MAVFHALDDNDCKKILHNLQAAMGNKSSYVIIADSVANEVNIDPIIASMDMQMLMGTKGRERTLTEWNNLFNDTGFTVESIMDTRSFAKFIILSKQ